jgi:pyrroline-5-carboxylate reductase
MTSFAHSLILVGAGRMGLALLRSWLKAPDRPVRIAVVEPHPSAELLAMAEADSSISLHTRFDLDDAAEVIVLAIKPQAAGTVLDEMPKLLTGGALVVSIMAGVTLASLEQHFSGRAVVRAMPNLAVAVGAGMTVAVANALATSFERDRAAALLGNAGRFVWLEAEELLDTATAVSGSGPAYVLLLAEALEAAGRANGLDAQSAALLSRMTIVGAGALLAAGSDTPAELRAQVTSPGGTTAAGIAALDRDGAQHRLVAEAVRAAADRARAMSSMIKTEL